MDRLMTQHTSTRVSSQKLRVSLSALAMCAFAMVPAHADPIGQIVVFGDSNADLGAQGPARRPTNQGQMWSERLATALGEPLSLAREIQFDANGDPVALLNRGGTSYAVNGATALSFDCCVSLGQQIDLFVADRGRFRADDLAFVWITRNDITTALPDGLPYSATLYADAFVEQIDRLRALGARNIVAFGAEIGLIPEQHALDLGTPPELIAVLREESRLADAALWPRLAERNVFIIDMDKLGEDVRRNPQKYGFVATTESYQLRDAFLAGGGAPIDDGDVPNDGNVFTVDGHYTSAMQAVVADYTLAQLRARDQFASVLSNSAMEFQTAGDALDALRRNDQQPGWRLVFAPTAGRIDQEGAGPLDPELNQTHAGAAFMVQGTLADGVLAGGGLIVQRTDAEFVGDSGAVKGLSSLLAGYISKRLTPGVSVELRGGYGHLDIDRFERRAKLGAAARERVEGSTSGHFTTAGVALRSEHAFQGWTARFGAGVDYQRTEIKGFDERPNVLALSYGDSHVSSILGSLDVSISGDPSDGQWRPFAALSVTRDFSDDAIDVKLGPTAATRATYADQRDFEARASGEIGAAVALSDSINLEVSGYAARWFGGEADSAASGVRLALAKRF